MDLPEKKQRWVFHADALPQPAGAGSPAGCWPIPMA